LGFKYDNVIVEEAAQILEIEAFVPLMLQKADPEAPPRLKRVVLIGDHHQLPPIVQNMAIARLGHLDQSLFARFARIFSQNFKRSISDGYLVGLGVPSILLDRQGRARPSLATLYNWRYKALGDLPHVHAGEYTKANPGFLYEYQLINVEDFQGRGESTPSPFFYQNLGEAEYVVACYMFMRMLGYPKEKVRCYLSYSECLPHKTIHERSLY
jgi:intron-binding protein aquarius